MWATTISHSDYQLIDFGDGRKMESFQGYTLVRPCPAAMGAPPLQPSAWSAADGVFVLQTEHRGAWTLHRPPPEQWNYGNWFGKLQLSMTNFGHLGVFPEQAAIWTWLQSLSSRVRGLRLLHLFAYTGGSTLAAAKLGAQVVHVDAAKNIVRRASQNARLSDLEAAPIRWIVDDALKFVLRQQRRQSEFDGFIIDPPSYGHGGGTARWQIDRDFPQLLTSLRAVCPRCQLMVVTCHSPGYDAERLKHLLVGEFSNSLPGFQHQLESGALELVSQQGGRLPAGFFARWCGGGSA